MWIRVGVGASAVATRGTADPPIRFRDRVRFSVD